MDSYKDNGKTVNIYKFHEKNAPVVYVSSFEENGAGLLEDCRKLWIRPFNLVTISDIAWDEEMSPWPSEPVVTKNDKFAGRADEYLEWLTKKVIPDVDNHIEAPSSRVLAGYSMAGMLSIYAACTITAFDGYVSASGSVWYPGFRDFVKEHGFKSGKAIYLSLGDKESNSRNKVLCTTKAVTQEIHEYCVSRIVRSIFELNPGNHFREPDLRLAKGIKWVLENL